MKRFQISLDAMNLHLFDGGAAAAGDGTGTGSAESGASETNSADNTQSATGRGARGTGMNPQDANAARQDIAVSAPDDEKRAQFETYIRGEGKQFFDEHFQKVFNQRFKEAKTVESNFKTVTPIIKSLSEYYGVKDGDYKALRDAVLNDTRLYEERAQENGVSVETQMKFDQMQRENDELKANEAERERQQRNQEILNDWHTQADNLKNEFPDFDFDYELDNNKDFYDLIVRGIPLRNAYIASNSEKVLNQNARQTEKRVTDNIRARGMRVSENGVSSGAAATSSFDVSKLTPSQRRDFANRAMKGETITFK